MILCVQPLTGMCLYFLRPNAARAITTENVNHEINFMFMDCSGGLLQTLDMVIDRIFAPVIRAQEVRPSAIDIISKNK